MCLAQGPQHSDAGEARTRGPDGVLKTKQLPKERHTISAQRSLRLCTSTELAEFLLRYRRPSCAAMVTVRRPHYALIRTPSVFFEASHHLSEKYLLHEKAQTFPSIMPNDRPNFI